MRVRLSRGAGRLGVKLGRTRLGVALQGLALSLTLGLGQMVAASSALAAHAHTDASQHDLGAHRRGLLTTEPAASCWMVTFSDFTDGTRWDRSFMLAMPDDMPPTYDDIIETIRESAAHEDGRSMSDVSVAAQGLFRVGCAPGTRTDPE